MGENDPESQDFSHSHKYHFILSHEVSQHLKIKNSNM